MHENGPADYLKRKMTKILKVSKKGWLARQTISKSKRTSFSLSPRYLEVNVLDDTLKNVVPHSVATALASIVLPVPANKEIDVFTQFVKREWRLQFKI